ncbi:MAG TPA: transferase [Polyangia bacterium]|jgi:serine O-acetyltransferase|nr:transferase [Polyangia bacterium]
MSEGQPPGSGRRRVPSPPEGRPLPLGDEDSNPPGMRLRDLLKEDFETHGRDLLSPGFWALAICRFGNWRMSRPRYVRPPLTIAYRFGRQAAIALWGIDIPYNSTVGRRVRIDHHGGFFLGALSVGDDVVIRHTATIGLIRRGASRAPVIGSNVEIGPGACIVGDITVGDGAFIGPNTVVTQDVPAGAFALGNPGRLVDRARVIDAPPARAADAPPAKQPPAVAPETAPVVAQSKL